MITPSTFDSLNNPFSQQYRNALKDMARMVCEVGSMASVVAELQARAKQTPDEVFFPARITGSTISATVAIWKYSWQELQPADSIGTNTDYTNRTDWRNGSSDASNLLEQGNTGSSAYGFAVGFSAGAWRLTTSPFTGMQFKPVPTGTVVWMKAVGRPTSGTLRYEFQAPNPINGVCP
jgi:hypothetical protein